MARVRAFDRHMNLLLENVLEMWTEVPKGNKGKKTHPANKERYHSKMFLRGDSVILILRNPRWLKYFKHIKILFISYILKFRWNYS